MVTVEMARGRVSLAMNGFLQENVQAPAPDRPGRVQGQVQEELAVPLRSRKGREGGPAHEQARRVRRRGDGGQTAEMLVRLPHDASLSDLALPDFELRLHQGQDVGPLR